MSAKPGARWTGRLARTTLVAVLLTVAGCGSDTTGDQTVLVAAAASLTDAFVEMEAAYEAATPGADVVLNLGGSAVLREQILGGAPVDVFASASITTMEPLVAAGTTRAAPQVFATNRMELAVPTGNPGSVAALDDLSRDELLVGLCAPGVPCGDFARTVLERAGVEPAIDTNEPNVRALLTKLEAGELDVGIVYSTDIPSAGGTVLGIRIPEPDNVAAAYPIAVLSGGSNQDGAAAFVAFVVSAEGRSILTAYGFEVP